MIFSSQCSLYSYNIVPCPPFTPVQPLTSVFCSTLFWWWSPQCWLRSSGMQSHACTDTSSGASETDCWRLRYGRAQKRWRKEGMRRAREWRRLQTERHRQQGSPSHRPGSDTNGERCSRAWKGLVFWNKGVQGCFLWFGRCECECGWSEKQLVFRRGWHYFDVFKHA